MSLNSVGFLVDNLKERSLILTPVNVADIYTRRLAYHQADQLTIYLFA